MNNDKLEKLTEQHIDILRYIFEMSDHPENLTFEDLRDHQLLYLFQSECEWAVVQTARLREHWNPFWDRDLDFSRDKCYNRMHLLHQFERINAS